MSVTLSQEKKMKLLKLNKLITYSPLSLRRRLLPYLLHATSLSCSSSSPQISPWSGLRAWRDSPLNENRFWGPNGPEALPLSIDDDCAMMVRSTSSLAELGALVLSTSDPLTKSKLSHLAFSKWCTEKLPIGSCVPPSTPARPDIPVLVSPKEVPAPKDSGLPLNAYMLHNLAHVELNAIDLAWDTVVRFSSISQILGEGFFADFAHVADDESRHFAWCSQRLSELGFKYGDMPAHNLLWRECEKSSDNVAARLATIPLVQEARGLDAGPRLVQKLIGCGDHKTSNIVARIADEEIAHVGVGVCWFVSLCQKMNCSPCSTFKGSGAADIINCYSSFSNVHELADLLSEYNVEVKGPFNYSAREEAGIPRNWYDKSLPSEQGENKRRVKNEQLSMVYERLTTIISMECQNANSVNPDG